MRPLVRPRQALRWIGFLLLLASLGALLPGVQPAASAQDDSSLYLPAVLGPPPPVLYGTVTFKGQPIAGISIDLWRYSNADPVIVSTAVTQEDGTYRFVDVPDLPSNQFYEAEFANGKDGQSPDDRFAGFCGTYSLDDYEGETLRLGDFDIDNISQATPANGATVKLPVTFSWVHDTTMTGAYNVGIFSPEAGGERFQSSDVMGAKTYTLDRLPAGFSYNKSYVWYLVYFTDQSFCVSHYSTYVTFRKK